MRIQKVINQNINKNQRLARGLEKFSEQGGENIANYINAAGKFAIAPLMIMFNPFSKESKKNKEWAAIKQPVEALVTIGAQVLSIGLLFKGIDKYAAKGKLNFKLVEDAKKDASKIPQAIIDATKDKLDKAGNPLDPIKVLEKNCLDIFKDRVGTILTIGLYVPILALSNRIFPIIADWLIKDNDND
ncbi:MAG: hypothetical protein E7Z87_07400 [Cyanobacteria bacterium SIG26]|nr:hypothetical protein [Cyanobacteria bacterium SIG26]